MPNYQQNRQAKRFRVAAIGVLAALISLVVPGVAHAEIIGTGQAAATKDSVSGCESHYFRVQNERGLHRGKWSVYGDLYDGKGKKVHHWQETSKDPNTADYVNWNFNYCGDGGHGDIWIDIGSKRYSFTGLALTRSYCWEKKVYNGRDDSTLGSC